MLSFSHSGPFTQRVLLTLEEKHLLYDMKFVDLSNKPDWLVWTPVHLSQLLPHLMIN